MYYDYSFCVVIVMVKPINARCNMPQKVGIIMGDQNGVFVPPGIFIVFVNGPGPASISEEQQKLVNRVIYSKTAQFGALETSG